MSYLSEDQAIPTGLVIIRITNWLTLFCFLSYAMIRSAWELIPYSQAGAWLYLVLFFPVYAIIWLIISIDGTMRRTSGKAMKIAMTGALLLVLIDLAASDLILIRLLGGLPLSK